MKRLVQNSIECLNCGEIVVSTHRHDYAKCGCGDVAADGGLDYTRRTYPGGDPGKAYRELSVWREDDDG